MLLALPSESTPFLSAQRTLQAQYARSTTSICSACLSPICSGELRIGITLPADTGEFNVVRWRHLDCMKQLFRLYGGVKAVTQDGLACARGMGFGTLQPAHRQHVSKLLEVSFFATKAEEVLFDAQQEQLDKTAAIITASISKNDLSTLFKACVPEVLGSDRAAAAIPLTHGGMQTTREVKVLAIADAIVFGKLPPCSICTINSWLSATSQGYRCNGHIDTFTRCTVKSDELPAPRTPLSLPVVLRGHPKVIKELEALSPPPGRTKPRVFLTGLTKLQAEKMPGQPQGEECKALAVDDLPKESLFVGCTFVVADELTDAAEWKHVIRMHGGTVLETSQLASKLAALDSSPDIFRGPPHLLLVADEAMYKSKSVYDNITQSARVVTLKWLQLALQWNQVPHPLSLPRLSDPLRVDPSWIAHNSPKLDAQELERFAAVQQKKISQKREEEGTANSSRDQKAAGGGTSTDETATSRKKVVFRGSVPVDAECAAQLPSTGEVLLNKSTGTPYSFSLASADVVLNKNKFYVAQVVLDASQSCYLFRRWGRVGDAVRNGIAFTKMSPDDAVRDFAKLYLDKTGNEWNAKCSSQPFVKHAGKMVLIETDDAGHDQASSSSNHKASVGSHALHPRTIALMAKLFDKAVMQQTMSEMSIDVKKMPVGSLRVTTLDAGRNILQEALKLSHISTASPTTTTAQPLSSGMAAKLTSLTNQFYSCIPHAFGQNTSLKDLLLDTPEKIAQKYALLDDLKAIALTQQINASNSSAVDPVAANLASLNLKQFEPLDDSHQEFQMALTYLTNTHGSTHRRFRLINVWKLKRMNELERFNPDRLTNRKLLWHGSRLTNWVRILQQGLRIAPPEAPVTGYMFGKGVYFADMFSKSANYCVCGTKGVDTGLLALAEVALGTPTVRVSSDYISTLPSGTHSCYAKGGTMPDPSHDKPWEVDKEVVVPLGAAKDTHVNGSLLYNEFIVYDERQIQLHYLLEVEPK